VEEIVKKLYSYSSEGHAIAGATWVRTKLAIGGILVGILLLFGFIKLDQSVGITPQSGPSTALAAENVILQRQISLISNRLSKTEMQAEQLLERSNELRILFHRREFAGDTVQGLTNAITGLEPRVLIPKAITLPP
jgi:hypothetical protein